jgi:hypothetical protein
MRSLCDKKYILRIRLDKRICVTVIGPRSALPSAFCLILPAMRERFAKLGARLVGNSPAEFAQQIVAERQSWGEIITAAGIVAE